MTSRDITTGGFVVLAIGLAGLMIAGRTSGLVRAGEALDSLLVRRSTRVIVVLIWCWLGWHFLARTDG